MSAGLSLSRRLALKIMARHREVDDNSVRAFRDGDRKTQATIIYRVYSDQGRPLTDRQVLEILGGTDMNEVRPAITKMMKEDPPRLEKSGNVKDHKTGRSVRAVRIAGPRGERSLFSSNDLTGVKKPSLDPDADWHGRRRSEA